MSPFITLPFNIWDRVTYFLRFELIDSARPAGQQPQEPFSLSLPSTGLQVCTIKLFTWVLGTQSHAFIARTLLHHLTTCKQESHPSRTFSCSSCYRASHFSRPVSLITTSSSRGKESKPEKRNWACPFVCCSIILFYCGVGAWTQDLATYTSYTRQTLHYWAISLGYWLVILNDCFVPDYGKCRLSFAKKTSMNSPSFAGRRSRLHIQLLYRLPNTGYTMDLTSRDTQKHKGRCSLETGTYLGPSSTRSTAHEVKSHSLLEIVLHQCWENYMLQAWISQTECKFLIKKSKSDLIIIITL